MEGVTIRPATSKDKQKVLSIRDVYGQYDYLPAYYDWFMKQENFFPFVAEMDQEIVAFVTICLVDNRETMFQRAGRISLRLEGTGLMTNMMKEIEKRLMSMNVRRKAQSVGNDNPRVKTPSFRQRHSLIMTRVFRSFLVEPNTLLKTLKSCHTTARLMDGTNFKTFYSQLTDSQISYLFPEGRIFIDSVTFRLQLSNFSIMNGPNTVYLEDVSERSGKIEGLLSVCTQHPLHKLGWLCFILDIHGTDIESLTNHLSFHIQRAMQTSNVKTHFIIYTERKISDEDMNTALNVLGIERNSSSSYYKYWAAQSFAELMVFESKL